MEYRILGALEAQHDREVVMLGPPKQRAILALLLLHAGELVPTDRLIDLVWGEYAPRTAAHSIQIYVSELRKEFDRVGGGSVIETRPPGYVLHADPETIDAHRFDQLVAEGRRLLDDGNAAAAASSIREALGLWRGPALSDFAYEEFAQDEIRRLEALRVDALDVSASAQISLGNDTAALASLDEAIGTDPLRERLRELQLLALNRAGRRPEALRAYQEFRTLLSVELGVDPSPSLREIYERILRHDPDVEAPDLGDEFDQMREPPGIRRARSKRWALPAAIALTTVVTVGLLGAQDSGTPDVVLLFTGTGDVGFGDMAAEGFERAVAEFGLRADVTTVSVGTAEVETELRRLSDDGAELVVVGIGGLAEQPTFAVASDHPGTQYVTWEALNAPPNNVTNITFRSEEGGYLAGAAAALKSRTRSICFIGGWEFPLIDAYRAGFESGARRMDPAIDVRSAYLTPVGDTSAFTSPQLGATTAARLYGDGCDVIFAVAGTSSRGVFEAAASASEPLGRRLWAIGVDTDAYVAVVDSGIQAPVGQDSSAWRSHILTSVGKRLDRAIYSAIADYAGGTLTPGTKSFGLAEGGVELSTSGGFIDDVSAKLDGLRNDIIGGEIVVPASPPH